MGDLKKLETLLVEKLTESSMYLVDFKLSKGGTIKVEIDSKKGITLKDCSVINKYLNYCQVICDTDYTLIVSSPGAFSSFKVKQQYLKNIGKLVKVLFSDGRTIVGILEQYLEDKIVVIESKKKEDILISIKNIKKISLENSF